MSQSPHTANTTQQFRKQTGAAATDELGNRAIGDFNATVHHPIIHVPAQITTSAPPTNPLNFVSRHMTSEATVTSTQHAASVHRSASHAMRRVSTTLIMFNTIITLNTPYRVNRCGHLQIPHK